MTDALSPSTSDSLAPVEAIDPELLLDLLAFRLGSDFFALPLRSVREILKVPPVTEVPRTKDHILGIISVRGRVTTVIDLRRRLELTELTEPGPQTRVLLVDDGAEVVGLLVDQVLQVYRLDSEEFELASELMSDFPEHIMGVGRPKAGKSEGTSHVDLLVLLDPKGLFRK